MFGWRKRRGRRGEQEAERLLRAAGYEILERNLSLGGGEMDLLAREGGELVCVEVRSRTGEAFGSPGESITATKARRLAKALRAYLAARGGEETPARCDVVAVRYDAEGVIVQSRIYRDCIDLQGALSRRRWRR
jgi:putative endonuclease